MFNDKTTQIKKNATAALENAHNLINASLEGIEKIASLNIELSKCAVEETSAAIKEMSRSTNPQEFIAKAQELASCTMERNINNCKNIYEILTATHSKINKMFESQFQPNETNSKPMSNWFSQFQATSPAAAINSMVNTANQAMNNAAKFANRASEITNSNFLSASQTLESVVKTAKKAAIETVATTQKAAAETVNTAKKAAAETVTTAKKATTEAVATVINSAKKAGETVAEATKQATNAAYANTEAKTAKPTTQKSPTKTSAK